MTGVTVPEEKQLTVVKAFRTLEENPEVELTRGGGYWNNAGQVCAISLYAVAELGLQRAKRIDVHDYAKLAREIGVSEAYVRGLENGFEGFRPPPGLLDVDDHLIGDMDGLCLRLMVERQSESTERFVQDLLREGLLGVVDLASYGEEKTDGQL